MTDQQISSTELPARNAGSRLAPHHIALAILWLVTTGVLVSMLFGGVRETDQYGAMRHALHSAYVLALVWYLCRSGPSTSRLPEIPQFLFRRWRSASWIPVIGIALVLILTMASDAGEDLRLLLLIISTVWILIAWRRQIKLRAVVQGLAVGLAAFLAGIPFMKNDFVGPTVVYLLPSVGVLMYIAGGLLSERTGLGGVQLLAGRYGQAIKSFLWGCLLFVPLGLINATDGSPGTSITWVREGWMPFSLPWFSGITEEIWFRLLLVGLCYFLLRPAFKRHPALAVLAAVLFSGITFGLGHGRTVERFLTTGLLYGVPMAVVFAKRDWEHAVGAHYMVNMIPWLAVFLKT